MENPEDVSVRSNYCRLKELRVALEKLVKERLKAENYIITITEQQIKSPSHNDDEYDVAAGGDKC